MRSILLPLATLVVFSAKSQLTIQDAVFFIGEGAVVTVQGNLTTNVDIQAGGSGNTRGKILMKGSALQTITVNGAQARAIPRLEIDNASHVRLDGGQDLRIENQLDLVTGKLQLFDRNLILPDPIVINGGNASRFIETNGNGEVRQLVPANTAGAKVLPIGTGANFTPAQFTVAGGSGFSATSYVGVRATGQAVPTPTRHPRTETYLATAWNVNRSGITGGTVNLKGTYVEGQVTGLGTPVEADIVGMFWNGTTWSTTGGSQDAGTNTVGANVSGNGTVYGMNKFILADLTAILQGAYNSVTGLMTEDYRTNNLLPSTDPYRTFTGFTHVQNATAEQISAGAFDAQGNGNNNIVDWVFVELRNSATPSTVAQTRSALIRRNGQIIDIDNLSPLYFKNVDPGNYVLTVRHRNHLAMSSNPANPIGLSLTPAVFNFSTTSAGNVLGTENVNYAFANSVRQMYAGDVNSNGSSNYIALGATDRSAMLSLLPGGSPSATRSINSTADYLNFGRGDLNFSRVVNYIALTATDRSYLLSTVLGGSATASKSQINP